MNGAQHHSGRTMALPLLVVAVVSCGGAISSKSPDERRPGRDALVLEAVAETQEGDTLRVSEGDTLQTGDRLWFRIETGGPAYIYLVQVFPDGSAGLLYPERGEVLLQAGAARRIPTDPRQHFVLDAKPGLEHVLLIASRRRLGESDKLLAELVEVVKRKRKWPSAIPLRAEEGEGTPAAAAPTQDEGASEAHAVRRQDSPSEPPPTGAFPRRPRTRPSARDGADGEQPSAAPATAKSDGFLMLLGPTRSLERGLQLRTDPSKLQVIPDAAGVAVSLFWFHHRP